jgi:serine/threonine protein kinase
VDLDRLLPLAIDIADAAMPRTPKALCIETSNRGGNIFVTERGHAKILDFGLAKVASKQNPTSDDADPLIPDELPANPETVRLYNCTYNDATVRTKTPVQTFHVERFSIL